MYQVESDAAPGATQQFAVNLDTRESDLEPVDWRRWSQLFRQRSDSLLPPAQVTNAGQQGMLRWALAAVACLLGAETFLAWRFGVRT